MIPVLQRAWKFMKGPAAGRIVGSEADVNAILRSDEPPTLRSPGEMKPETLALIKDVLGGSFDEATEKLKARESEVLELLRTGDVGCEETKQAFLKALESVRTADPGWNHDDLKKMFGASEKFYDPTRGSQLDWDRMRQFTMFPEVVDRAKIIYERSQSEVPGLAQEFDIPVKPYLEAEFNRLKEFCGDALKVAEELELQEKQLLEFEEMLPKLRVDDILKANPELAKTLQSRVDRHEWFVDEEAVDYDDAAAEAERASRLEALNRWEIQLNEDGQRNFDNVFNKGKPSSLTQYNFLDVFNTSGDSWPSNDTAAKK